MARRKTLECIDTVCSKLQRLTQGLDEETKAAIHNATYGHFYAMVQGVEAWGKAVEKAIAEATAPKDATKEEAA